MFISRMPLNGARPQAAAIISSPNRMHAAVEAAFPPVVPDEATPNGRGRRILWRIDPIPDAGRSAWLYVVSPGRPDFTHLCEQAGWPTEGVWQTKDYSPLLDKIAKGQRWQFRLKANPVRKVFQDKGTTSKSNVIGTIQGHVTVEQQMRWLLDRAESHGFLVCFDSEGYLQLGVSQRGKGSFSHGKAKVTLTTAVFDGVLEIADAEAFRRTLCNGVGRAKAFGCGLLTVAPLPQP